MGTLKFLTVSRSLSSGLGLQRSFRVRASDDRSKDDEALGIREDLNYLWKLGAGSIAGAAAIKYGSIILPEITRPNLLQALFMISFPVVISVVLLFRQSYVKR